MRFIFEKKESKTNQAKGSSYFCPSLLSICNRDTADGERRIGVTDLKVSATTKNYSFCFLNIMIAS